MDGRSAISEGGIISLARNHFNILRIRTRLNTLKEVLVRKLLGRPFNEVLDKLRPSQLPIGLAIQRPLLPIPSRGWEIGLALIAHWTLSTSFAEFVIIELRWSNLPKVSLLTNKCC
ncbi:MAG: hypothetical protein ACTS6P_02175 [Candidatus Hodgkinia cicadicola]